MKALERARTGSTTDDWERSVMAIAHDAEDDAGVSIAVLVSLGSGGFSRLDHAAGLYLLLEMSKSADRI